MFNPNLSDAGIPSQSPFLGGLTQGADTYTQLLNAFAAPQMMKLKQQQAQADLQSKLLQNQFYPQSTQSKIDLQNMQSQYGPMKAVASVQNALNNSTRQATSQERLIANTKIQTVRNMTPAQKAVWMADPKNQAEYQDLWNTATLGTIRNTPPNVLTPDFLKSQGLNPQYASQQQQPQMGAPEAMPTQTQPSPPGMQNQLSPEQIQALQGQASQPAAAQLGLAAPQQAPNVPRGTQDQLAPTAQNLLSPPSDQYWINQDTGQPQIIVGKPTAPLTTDQRGQLANMIHANKLSSSPQMQARLNAAVGLSNFMYSPEMQKSLVTMSKYSGLLGKSESYIKSRLNPQEMAEFQAAKATIPTLVGGGVKYLEGIQTSDKGMEQSRAFIDLSENQKAWKNDPDATLKDWLERYNLADAESRAIADAAQPIYKVFKFPENRQPEGLVGALSKNRTPVAAQKDLGNGQAGLKGPDGKWYKYENGKVVEVQEGE